MSAEHTHSGVHRLAVVGVGMMGGSLALAARARAEVDEVVGFDNDPAALQEALAKGVITEIASSAAEAAAYADLVVVSTPVRSIPALVEECASADPRPRLITDMGSTKSAIVRGLSAEARSLFIGGHPMCGAADSGVRYARADLFQGATYFLCTTGAAFPKLYAMLQQFVLDLGARPTHIDAEAHDQILAVISHLPHVLANALMQHAGGFSVGGKRALQWVGASFTDLTRVAGANPPMWRDIFLENREALCRVGQGRVGAAAGFLHTSRRLRRGGRGAVHRIGGGLPRRDAGIRRHHAGDAVQSHCQGARRTGRYRSGHDGPGRSQHQRGGPHAPPHESQRGWRPGGVCERRGRSRPD